MRMGFSKRILLGTLMLATAAAIIGVQKARSPAERQLEAQPSPWFSIEQGRIEYHLSSSQGEWHSSQDNQDKVVMLYFWATWCQPCKKMILLLNSLWLKYRESGLVFTAISLDTESQPLQNFIESNHLKFPCPMVPPELMTANQSIKGIPTLYLVSRKNVIFRKYQGLRNSQELEDDVRKLLRLEDGKKVNAEGSGK